MCSLFNPFPNFQGYFLTDNKSVNKFANEVLKVALSGLSLTVISFTIVFLVRTIHFPIIIKDLFFNEIEQRNEFIYDQFDCTIKR